MTSLMAIWNFEWKLLMKMLKSFLGIFTPQWSTGCCTLTLKLMRILPTNLKTEAKKHYSCRMYISRVTKNRSEYVR